MGLSQIRFFFLLNSFYFNEITVDLQTFQDFYSSEFSPDLFTCRVVDFFNFNTTN